MTRVKICGITDPRDAELAVRCGADALGFVFEPSSPRFIGRPSVAAEIVRDLPPYVTAVAVFGPAPVDPPPDELGAIQCLAPIANALIGHRKWIQVLRVPAGSAPESLSHDPLANAVLVDAYDEHAFGGTGKTADWALASDLSVRFSPLPVVLAGGLRPDNVARAIRQVRPFAVDVASGVEKEPGIKDPEKLRRFFEAVREADN